MKLLDFVVFSNLCHFLAGRFQYPFQYSLTNLIYASLTMRKQVNYNFIYFCLGFSVQVKNAKYFETNSSNNSTNLI